MNTFRGEIVHASGRLGRSTNNSSSSIPNRADVKQHKDNESDESEGKTAFKTKLFKLPVAFKYLGFYFFLRIITYCGLYLRVSEIRIYSLLLLRMRGSTIY